jgi:hypothetical protein
MGEEHASATIAIEAQLVQDLSHLYSLSRLPVFISLPNQHAELVPLMSNNLTAAEATHWDDHMLI